MMTAPDLAALPHQRVKLSELANESSAAQAAALELLKDTNMTTKLTILAAESPVYASEPITDHWVLLNVTVNHAVLAAVTYRRNGDRFCQRWPSTRRPLHRLVAFSEIIGLQLGLTTDYVTDTIQAHVDANPATATSEGRVRLATQLLATAQQRPTWDQQLLENRTPPT